MASNSKKYTGPRELVLLLVLALGIFGIALTSYVSTQSQLKRSQAAVPVLNAGVMGDSVSDEYRAPEDNRAPGYAATTHNWLEQLVKYRNVSFGAWKNWGGFRRTGYEFNYSRSGATTQSGLDAGAHVALGEQVSTGKVQVVYYQLGSNDFAWYNSIADDIYSGRLSGTQLDGYITRVVGNVRTALVEINKSQKAKVLVSLVPDTTITPAARQRFPDAVKLKRVSDAVKKANLGIQSEVSQRGYAIFNTEQIANNLISKVDSQGNLVVAGEKISFVTAGDEPHHVQLGDKIHAGAVYSSVYANEWIAVVNTLVDVRIQPFTENDMLIQSGIKQPTTAPTSTATTTATARATASPTTSTSPTNSPTTRPTNSPSSSPRPTASATVRPTIVPTSTAKPTPTPTTNPYAQYCGTYRSFRSVIVRFLSASQISQWDQRCGI